jgi:hypothetical protein
MHQLLDVTSRKKAMEQFAKHIEAEVFEMDYSRELRAFPANLGTNALEIHDDAPFIFMIWRFCDRFTKVFSLSFFFFAIVVALFSSSRVQDPQTEAEAPQQQEAHQTDVPLSTHPIQLRQSLALHFVLFLV